MCTINGMTFRAPCISKPRVHLALYHDCIYDRFPEDGPSDSKHVEDKNKLLNINLEKVNFVLLYCVTARTCSLPEIVN